MPACWPCRCRSRRARRQGKLHRPAAPPDRRRPAPSACWRPTSSRILRGRGGRHVGAPGRRDGGVRGAAAIARRASGRSARASAATCSFRPAARAGRWASISARTSSWPTSTARSASRQIDAGDSGVSWLPLYHDMGLIGFVLAPMCAQRSVDLLAPRDFARRPLQWLSLISRRRATITYSPSFGYELVARRAQTQMPGELDLSCLRTGRHRRRHDPAGGAAPLRRALRVARASTARLHAELRHGRSLRRR